VNIKVASCSECPFRVTSMSGISRCNLAEYNGRRIYMTKSTFINDTIDERCPLKNESYVIWIEE